MQATVAVETIIHTPIETVEQGKAYIKALIAADMMYHFEDDIFGILWGTSFDRELLPEMDKRTAELYVLGSVWGQDECPIGYALSIMEPEN